MLPLLSPIVLLPFPCQLSERATKGSAWISPREGKGLRQSILSMLPSTFHVIYSLLRIKLQSSCANVQIRGAVKHYHWQLRLLLSEGVGGSGKKRCCLDIYSFLTCNSEDVWLRDAMSDAPLGLMIIFNVFRPFKHALLGTNSCFSTGVSNLL